MNSRRQFNIQAEIEQHPIFSLYPPWAQQKLVKDAFVRRYRRGETIMAAGEDPPEILMVLQGMIFFELLHPDGRKFTGPAPDSLGELLGLLPILFEELLPYNLLARQPTTMLCISRQALFDILAQEPHLMAPVFQLMSQRFFFQLNQGIHALIQRPRERLVKTLLDLSRRYGVKTDQGTVIDVGISQDDLSFMLSLSRQSINKELRQLADDGVIATAYGTITIIDHDRLQQLERQGLSPKTPEYKFDSAPLWLALGTGGRNAASKMALSVQR